MKSICKVFIGLFAIGVMCQAIPLDRESELDNEIIREERQVKGTAAATSEQAEVKMFNGQLFAPMAAGAMQALNTAANGLQAGRLPGLMLQGPYSGLSYGVNGGLGINGQFNTLAGGFNYPNGNAGLTTQPSNGFDLYPQYMPAGGLLPNAGASLATMGTMNPFEHTNLQGLNTHLVAQPSQLQYQQIAPYPFMQGYFPQLGFNPAIPAYQG